MSFNKINFKLCEEFKHVKISAHVPLKRTLATPEELYILCEFVVDPKSIPEAFSWKNNDVVHWIESIGFPQYRLTFYENLVHGRSLVLVDASALSHMNITNFEHIKKITKAIRDLFNIENIHFKRSISLPPRYPDTHHKFYKAQNGPKYERIKRTELWRKMKILREKQPYMDHWDKLTEWLKHIPDYQLERIGYAPQHRLYYVKPKGKQKLTKFAPCEYKSNERNYKLPWRFECLVKRGINSNTNLPTT